LRFRSGTNYKNPRGDIFRRLAVRAFNLEDHDDLELFKKGNTKEITVPGSSKKVLYDPMSRVGVGISRIGTSKAIALGAYAFALKILGEERNILNNYACHPNDICL